MSAKKRVLFLCVGNSCRSQMAEGLLRAAAPDKFDVFSAGADPAGLNSRAVQVMAELGIDISGHRSEAVEQFAGQTFDYVVTVCERSGNARCPVFVGQAGHQFHWPFEDPTYAEGDEETVLGEFRRVRDLIKARLESFIETDGLREHLIDRMEAVFGSDRRRIDHAMKVLEHAEAIHEGEGGDCRTVTAAAILHDIGIHQAEQKHGSSAGRFQEMEGPPIARTILQNLGVDARTTDHVCRIVGSHHSANDIDTLEFRILWDADWLVNIPDEHPGVSQEKLADLIERIFKTARGRQMAEELFLAEL